MRTLVLWGALCFAVGCGHATRVRPTPQGGYEVEAAVGGPLVSIGPVIPVPMSTVGVRYGFHARGDIAAHLHLTSAVFNITGGDLDSTWRLLDQSGARPQLSANGRLYAFNKEGVVRNYFELTPSASWLIKERYLSYLSATGLVQFAGGPLLWSVAGGEEVRFGHFALQVELRWYEPGLYEPPVVVDWVPLFAHGGLGVVVAASYRFGGGR